MAEGYLRDKLEKLNKSAQVYVDSAGTSGYHDGEAPDVRAIEIMHANRIDISEQISRKITSFDLEEFDYILCADERNLAEVKTLATREQLDKISLILDFSNDNLNKQNNSISNVPDPYYNDGFHRVYNLLAEALDNFITVKLKL